MKALSIQQPHAHLIVYHGKDIENRDWPTSYRGPVLIHASKRPDTSLFVEEALTNRVTTASGRYLLQEPLGARGLWQESMPRQRSDCQYGGIIGVATIIDCVRTSGSPWFRGPYGFVLRDARPLPFLPLRGRLGVFEVEDTRLAPMLVAHAPLQEGESAPTLQALLKRKRAAPRPRIVCLCGSTRFMQAFQDASLRETLAGRIVLSIGCDTKSDHDLALGLVDKIALDLLHLWKIDLADEILVLNVGNYVGASTRREIAYARLQGKQVRWLEPMAEEAQQ